MKVFKLGEDLAPPYSPLIGAGIGLSLAILSEVKGDVSVIRESLRITPLNSGFFAITPM